MYSVKWDRYYVGSTQDIDTRLEQHNSGRNRSTKGGVPWVLKYQESFTEIGNARKREIEIKRKKSRVYLEWLISSGR